MSDEVPYFRTLPEGQEATLRALAAAMFRGAAALAVGTAVLAVVVAGLVVGVDGVLGALAGSVLALLASLLTLWLIQRTATQAPNVVMVASLGGFLLKMIVLLAVLTLLGGVGGVHRQSLALSMLAVFVVVAAAESIAAYRMRMLSVSPGPAP
ncbi:MAG: hypothetical protein LH603_11680 [Pseudonocardia sp.]|nr:hypothetical protein [Pseudonocardia sp.]